MEKKSKVTEFLLKAFKGMLRVVLWVLILFLLAALSLQIPYIQTETIQLLTHQLSENTDFETKIQKVNIKWWDAISLSGLTVHDQQDSLMANLEEVYIDFSLRGLMDRENPGIDEIRLKSGKLRIITHEEGELPNISTFIANLNSILRSKKKSERKKSSQFNIDRITFETTSVDILNYSRPIMEKGFDYNRLRFRDLVGGAENFFTQSDTIGFDILYLRGLESNSGMEFQQLRADFEYSTKAMEFRDLFFKSNQTEIKNYLRFNYENIRSLRDFNNQVDIVARLDESVLDIKDLKFFTENIPDVDDRIYLSGEITGKVNDLYSEELLVRFGERSALFGKFNIEGLPKVDSTFFQLSLVNSTLTSKDLAPYLDKAGRKEINKFKDIRFDSDFTGYLHNFTANGDFRTRIGHIIGKLNYKNTTGQPKYNGRLTLKDLDLGILMEDPETFQKVSLQGNIKGTGASIQSALLELDANVNKIGINNYNYSGIQTNATYGKDLFEGQLSIHDPNLKVNLNGILDLREGKDSARLSAQLDTAFLKPLNFSEKEAFISGGVELDTKGTNVDEIEGIARFKDLLVSYEGRSLSVDNFFFQSIFTEDNRLISLNSDLLVASITGKFKTREITQDIQKLWKEYYAIITNADFKNEGLEEEKQEEYSIDINMRLNDINPIINLFAPSVYVSKNTQVEGAFYQTQENTIFNFYTGMDTIVYKGHYFLENDLDFNTAKIKNSKEVLAAFYINSKRQNLSSGINFHNLSMEAIWDESAIDFSMGIDQLKTNSYARIESEIEIFNNYTSIVFEPSDIKLLDHLWKFSPENSITISNGQIDVDNLKLSNKDQYLALNGRVSQNPEDILSLEINDLNLDFLNTFDLKEYEGIANGTLAFNNLYEKTESNGSLEIRDFHINNFLIGDIEAATYFENERINLQLTNYREDKKVIEIKGDLGTEKEELDLEGIFEEANLSVMEPFLSDYLTEFGGTVSGKIQIGDSMAKPEIRGAGNLTGGRVRINYLNTLYTVDGRINFSPNEISFRGLNVTDVQGNQAQLRGGIAHAGFKDFILDITSDLDNFQVLNTSLKDNNLFYGTAYASGTLDILGAASNLDINADATTEPNTKIFIPIGSTEGQSQEDYINIINVRDTTQTVNIEETVEKLAIKNVRMNFTLDVTPDAYAEIQIDPRTGENIQGRGRGVLNLNIDTQGTFSMRGDYEIVDAQYNFSLYNIINKQFEILPGGRISWFGNPYEGVMNIKATYEENVSLSSLQNNSTSNPEFQNTQLHRRYPVKVIMDLQGPLLSPNISFDFDFSEFPEGDSQTAISAFKNRMANDEQEKNRQVFSLIMMRRFSPEGQFNSAGIGFSNLSQLVSSQLNALISQVDQNLEIDFDLASLDETALETFQLRVAYTFLDGRLRVTRDGSFTDPQGNADLGSIAGDWQAEYLLTDDGRYRLRIYNRNNFNLFTSLNIADRVNTYGVSLSQTLMFSSFKELFKNLRKKRKEKMLINDSDDFLRYKSEEQSEEIFPNPSEPKSDETEINILEMPPSPEN